MKRSAADPSHARGEELREDAARWRSASFGSSLGGSRLTFRPPRHEGERRTFAYMEGDGGIRSLFFYFVFVVVVLGVAAVLSISAWVQEEQEELVQVRLQNGPVTCEWLESGHVRLSTTVDLGAEFPFVRDRALEHGVDVEWTVAVRGGDDRFRREVARVSEDGHIEQVLSFGGPQNTMCWARVAVAVPV